MRWLTNKPASPHVTFKPRNDILKRPPSSPIGTPRKIISYLRSDSSILQKNWPQRQKIRCYRCTCRLVTCCKMRFVNIYQILPCHTVCAIKKKSSRQCLIPKQSVWCGINAENVFLRGAYDWCNRKLHRLDEWRTRKYGYVIGKSSREKTESETSRFLG